MTKPHTTRAISLGRESRRMISDQKKVMATGVALVSIYSVQFVAARFSLQGELTATDLTVLRYLVAGAIFAPYFLVFNGLSHARGLGIGKALALFLCAGFPYLLVINTGISLTSAGYVAAVGPGSIVLFSFILPFVLLSERPDGVALFSTAAILVGIILFVLNTFIVDGISLVGTCLFVLQGFMFSMYGVLIRRWQVDAILGTAVISVASAVPAIFMLAVDSEGLLSASGSELASQAFIQGALAGAASVFLYSYIVQLIGPQRASLFMPSVPILSTFGGYVLLNETLTLIQICGVLAMVFGMSAPGLMSIRRTRQTLTAQE